MNTRPRKDLQQTLKFKTDTISVYDEFVAVFAKRIQLWHRHKE